MEELTFKEVYLQNLSFRDKNKRGAIEDTLDMFTNGLFAKVEEPKRSQMITDALKKVG